MNPHLLTPLRQYGDPIGSSCIAIVLVHGRGQAADTMLDLAKRIDMAGIAYIALEAADNTWYPKSFLAPVEENQPHLDNAIACLEGTVAYLGAHGYAADQIVFLGFSQGACLACEFVFRHPRRWGGLMAFTGGLIGAEPSKPFGRLDGTPVLISGSDCDAFVPLSRMNDTAATLDALGASVRERHFADSEHHVNDAQIAEARNLIRETQRCARLARFVDQGSGGST